MVTSKLYWLVISIGKIATLTLAVRSLSRTSWSHNLMSQKVHAVHLMSIERMRSNRVNHTGMVDETISTKMVHCMVCKTSWLQSRVIFVRLYISLCQVS